MTRIKNTPRRFPPKWNRFGDQEARHARRLEPFLSARLVSRRAGKALVGYVRSEAGTSASEVALMLLILGGCVATALHALGAH